jgi:hypothetical protein
MSKKSKVIVAAAIAVFGLNSQAFADSLANVSVTRGSAHPASCSDQIADLRQSALLNHQPMPETVWQARTYAGLMFAADLALAEAQDVERHEDECLLAARRAKQELQDGLRYSQSSPLER